MFYCGCAGWSLCCHDVRVASGTFAVAHLSKMANFLAPEAHLVICRALSTASWVSCSSTFRAWLYSVVGGAMVLFSRGFCKAAMISGC